jgi:hypothetical protein
MMTIILDIVELAVIGAAGLLALRIAVAIQ